MFGAQVFLGKFRGRGPLPIPGGPLIGAQCPDHTPASTAAAQLDDSPAAAADATADEPLAAAPSLSGHSSHSASHGGGGSGSGGSVGTSVREHTPECAIAQPAGLGGGSMQAGPSSRDSSPASADAEQGGAISPPAGGWRPARQRQRRPAQRPAAADVANGRPAARSPQTRRQLALQQEQWELEVALARSAAEAGDPAAAVVAAALKPAAASAPAAPAVPPPQPEQPTDGGKIPLEAAAAAQVPVPLMPGDATAPAQHVADDAVGAPAVQAPSAPNDPAQQSVAPEPSPTQPQLAAAAMSEPATGLLSDEETVSLVAVSDSDVDIGTTSALQVTMFLSVPPSVCAGLRCCNWRSHVSLAYWQQFSVQLGHRLGSAQHEEFLSAVPVPWQGPMTRSGRTPQKGLPRLRRAGRSAAGTSASKPPQRQAHAAGAAPSEGADSCTAACHGVRSSSVP